MRHGSVTVAMFRRRHNKRLRARARNKWTQGGMYRVPINVRPTTRDNLRSLLESDARFWGVGFSDFIDRAVNAERVISQVGGSG